MAGARIKKIVTVNYSFKVGDIPEAADVPIAAIYQTPQQPQEIKSIQQRQNYVKERIGGQESTSVANRRLVGKKKDETQCEALGGSIVIILLIIGVVGYSIYKSYDDEWEIHLKVSTSMDKYRDNNIMGDVLVKINQDSGIINDEDFGMNEANVVCRELGYPLGAAGYSVQGLFGSNIKADFVLDDLKCLGNEDSIENCQFDKRRVDGKETWTTKLKKKIFKGSSYKHQEPKDLTKLNNVAGVICKSGNIGTTRSILINGTAPSNGHVFAINNHGYFGPICDQNFGPNEAGVLCYQLGYPTAESYSIGSYYGDIPRNSKFAMNSLACNGNENSLGECATYKMSEDVCNSNHAAGVVCSEKLYEHDQSTTHGFELIEDPEFTIELECLLDHMVGDGYCDDYLNVHLCDFDGGDCCGINPNTHFCFDCQCHPEALCLDFLMGDGICHEVNNKSSCGFDAGDCLTGCNSSLLFNYHCDSVNNKPECDYDMGDCIVYVILPEVNVSNTCSPWLTYLIGDGVCQDIVNVPECNYDGRDCCEGLMFECVDCICHDTCDQALMENGVCDLVNNKVECFYDNGDCWVIQVPYVICLPFLIGDGHCDSHMNKTECNFDGGDCMPMQCSYPEWVNDGICDMLLNTVECEYDGGDCDMCPFDLLINDGHCDLSNNLTTCNFDGTDCLCNIELKGNGICDADNNNDICDYDGNDCNYESCLLFNKIGDGQCDSANYYPSCNYDEGDCGSCHVEHFNDGICQEVNNQWSCNYDYGDCFNGTTSWDCNSFWISDGWCDDINNKEVCSFDGGDCCGPTVNTDFCSDCICYEDFYAECDEQWIGDGYCDDSQNTEACRFDEGDCCGGLLNPSFCIDCECHETPDSLPDPEQCVTYWIGDLYCDDANNIEACNYDGNDCCNPEANMDICIDCECKHNGTDFNEPTMEPCPFPLWIGDKYCDDITNTENCGYDGGDCCGDHVVTEFCNQCQCLELEEPWYLYGPQEHFQELFTGEEVCKESWINDGFCDDENNVEMCGFDGGDCCGDDVDKAFCEQCYCYTIIPVSPEQLN